MYANDRMMRLMSGSGGYNMQSYGEGLVGGGLPQVLKNRLKGANPDYRQRSLASAERFRAQVASGERKAPPGKGSVEARARGAAAAATRKQTARDAADLTMAQAAEHKISNLGDLHEMYIINKLHISRNKAAEKGKAYRDKKKMEKAATKGQVYVPTARPVFVPPMPILQKKN